MDRTRTDDLLLCCLRAAADEALDGRLRTLSSSDWDVLIHESGRYGVVPLLYHRLRTFHSDVPVPPNVMARIRRIHLQEAARGVHLYHELGKVLGRLRQADIPVIVLKGAHLAALVYGGVALRPMGDVDVLVHKDDLMRAEAALLGMGYAPTECHRQIAADNCHFNYGLPNGDLFVEVHWHLLPSMYCPKIDIDAQWERSRKASIAGIDVSVLCPEDLLLYLCVHAAKHLFEMGLKPLCDIVETIRHYEGELDWKQVQGRSRQWAQDKSVYLTLRLARELLGAPVPNDLMKAVKPDDFDERFMALASRRIVAYGQWRSDGLSLRPVLAQLWGSKPLLRKGALFLRRAFPPRDELARKYPAPSDSQRIYFYYAVRIKDVLLRDGRQVWRLLRGDEGMRQLARQEDDMAQLGDWFTSTSTDATL